MDEVYYRGRILHFNGLNQLDQISQSSVSFRINQNKICLRISLGRNCSPNLQRK